MGPVVTEHKLAFQQASQHLPYACQAVTGVGLQQVISCTDICVDDSVCQKTVSPHLAFPGDREILCLFI